MIGPFSISDMEDHLRITRDFAEGVYMAANGLSVKEDRNGLATLVEHLNERLDFLAARLGERREGGAS